MTRTKDCLTGTTIQGALLTPSRESWPPPEEDWVKVNVDGAYSRVTAKSACGGPIHDSTGKFVKGFIHHMDEGERYLQKFGGVFLVLEWHGIWGSGKSGLRLIQRIAGI